MLKQIAVASLAITLGCLSGPSPAAAGTLPLNGYIVCIDPGHQLHSSSVQEPLGPGSPTTKPCVSSGTSGSISGPEHAVVLDVGLRLRTLLEADGATVVMTRTTADVNICNSTRAIMANDAHAHLFVRLHCDATSGSGASMLYPANIPGWTDDIYAESLRAAGIVQTAYLAATGLPNRGLVPRSDLTGFNFADVPSILPEMLNMSHSGDDANAANPTYRQTMAQGLADGIEAYLLTLPPPVTDVNAWQMY
jgi:N-acetylmuramoyl-L-alanine amidase